LNIEKKVTSVSRSIITLLYQQPDKKGPAVKRSNKVPVGKNRSQRDSKTKLKQARVPGTKTAELS